MTEIYKTALVAHSAEDMYQLVSDIETYPQFLPWCKSTKILSQHDTEVVASIAMGGAGMEKSFTTANVLKPNEIIEMHLQEGPFSHLYGKWEFQQLGDVGCKVALRMEFEISNTILRLSLEPVFSRIVNSLVDAFVKRADDLYARH
ncbi:type II toxin-antitoxin system RatA family toxin [Candidatus Albibeggiatoa sp. nov. NOAA]|uniref:type II toxin-antitoxin system RatA family toxin n=1 Tax=Candidatus Albibeggiatoa sp. nov. NOAA TaxID=3162724 RepID=UPI0032F9183B|nr:type II toxin-antitoxin system RatA family toxin [Thiotrichaceae bacterium]